MGDAWGALRRRLRARGAFQAPFWRQRVRNRSLLARKCLLGAELAPESASRTESRPKSPLRRRFLAGRAISPGSRRRGILLPGNKIPSIHIRRANVYRPGRVTDSFTNVYRDTRTQRIVRSPSRHKKRVPISGDPRTLVVSEAGLEPARGSQGGLPSLNLIPSHILLPAVIWYFVYFGVTSIQCHLRLICA